MHVDEGICVGKRGDIMKNIGITSVCEKMQMILQMRLEYGYEE